MKRTLSLVLALVMVLGTFTGVFAQDVNAEVEAGLFLEERGVLTGNLDGDLMLGQGMKRRDAVVMLSRLMDVEEVAANFPGAEEVLTFKDLKDEEGNFVINDYYASMITWAVTNEYFKGDHEGNFNPDNAITAREYLTVLLRALGYGDVAWGEVMETAVEVGLVEDTEEFEFTRGTMAVLTVVALNTNLKDSDETLAEKLGVEMPEPPTPEVLEVEDVVADNLKEVKVLFNKEVDVDLEDAELFSIKGLTIEEAVMEDNVLVLSIKDKMVNNRDYKLVVKGTDEVDGTYDFKAYDNEVPYVVDVVALGTKAIKVILSEPVQTVTSTNFRLDGKTLYAGVPVNEGKEIIIRPYTELSLGEHDLTVRGLKDFNNFISIESNHKFDVAEDKDAPTIVDVSATLERVVVTFSEDVDPNTVNDKSVYWKEGSTKRYPSKATALAGNRYAFDFTGNNTLPVYETTLYVEKVADYSGNEMVAAEVPVKAVIDETRPEVVSAELDTDLKTVIVKFTKAVKTDSSDNSALEKDNYRVLDDKDNKLSIYKVEEKDSKTFEVVLSSALSENKNYTIKISGIQDTNKYANTMYDYNGNISVGVTGQPEIKAVTGTFKEDSDADNKNTISILFSRAMDLSTIVDPANYIVKIGDAIRPLADVNGYVEVVRPNGSLVKVIVEGEDVKEVTQIAVLGAKDTNGKLLKQYGEMQDVKEAELKVNEDKVVATGKKEVKVTFTEPIEKAVAKDFRVIKGTTNYVVDEITGTGTDTLTLKLASELDEDVEDTKFVIVKDNKIVGDLGGKFDLDADDPYDIKDKIRPTWKLADKNPTVSAAAYDATSEIKIVLEFNEDVTVDTDLPSAFQEVKVIRAIDGKKMDIELAQGSNLKFLDITFDSDVDSYYSVEIKDKAVSFLDDKENTIVGKTVDTNSTIDVEEEQETYINGKLTSGELSVTVDEKTVAKVKSAIETQLDNKNMKVEVVEADGGYKATITFGTAKVEDIEVNVTVAP